MPYPRTQENKKKASKAFAVCGANKDSMSKQAYERCVSKVYKDLTSSSSSSSSSRKKK